MYFMLYLKRDLVRGRIARLTGTRIAVIVGDVVSAYAVARREDIGFRSGLDG